ncbi:MAG: hypothetical protein KDA20_06955 [Phycisphaerales bacterium]|nr:hypothetical protein [Phycisphaerales bacterium]
MRLAPATSRRLFPLAAVALGATAMLSIAPACSRSASADTPQTPTCTAELRSWVVAGWGRHMYLQIDCPCEYDNLDGRVEYTSAAMRSDYVPPDDPEHAARVTRMQPGYHLQPMLRPGEQVQTRLEAVFTITVDQAKCLQRDRMFASQYALLGTNSSSGLRRAAEDCGCAIPPHVANAGGALGEFPGVNFDPGDEVPGTLWDQFGFPAGPTSIPQQGEPGHG